MNKRKLMLERRIARLEKLISNKGKTAKNEAALPRRIYRDLTTVFDDHLGGEYNYDSIKELKENLWAASQCENDMMVDDAIMYLSSDHGYDEDDLEDLRDEITDDLAELADEALREFDDYDDDYGYDEEDDDEFDECVGRNCESRKRPNMKRKSESNTLRRKIKNEDVKKLPNGMLANRVSDVLSAWADTNQARPRDAIRELERKGILDAATNKWYTTVDDVADAIEDCWDDQIGAVGAGAAQFFIGNIGGATRCSLTLYPISGGTSRARNLVLKFNWPDSEEM